jgi:FO synthase
MRPAYVHDDGWTAGAGTPPPRAELALAARARGSASAAVRVALERVRTDAPPLERDLVTLFAADGDDYHAVVRAADALRRELVGDAVTYVVNRNINYTNICSYSCGFCAFAKGRSARAMRGPAYDLDHAEIAARVREAAARGATEVCLQGGIHPNYTGATYLAVVRTVVEAVPDMHVHAFSPLEVLHGAETLGLGVREYLSELKAAGLRTLPGTAAEILCDDVRAEICPDKLDTEAWLSVMRAAHEVGLRSTSTIMFGHVESPHHWARHLLALHALQRETQGFTEFVPLPFVHMEAPMWRRGRARNGPSFREAVLMHAVARLAFGALLPNIQTSWVKMGRDGALAVLDAGANDLGGVLMNESITRAAGGVNGQEMDAASMRAAITFDRTHTARAQHALRRRSAQFGQNQLADDVQGFHRLIVQPQCDFREASTREHSEAFDLAIQIFRDRRSKRSTRRVDSGLLAAHLGCSPSDRTKLRRTCRNGRARVRLRPR